MCGVSWSEVMQSQWHQGNEFGDCQQQNDENALGASEFWQGCSHTDGLPETPFSIKKYRGRR